MAGLTMEKEMDIFTVLQSENINELVKALSVAQGQIGNAVKDAANPFFKSKYADLASVREAIREPMAANGLAVVQLPTVTERGTYLCTTLAHSSGQWMRSFYPIKPVKDDPQGMGSAITYARRYALSAITGVAPEDDDGNAASGKKTDSVAVVSKDGIGAPGNRRTGNKAVDQWVDSKIGEINEIESIDELAKVYRLAIKHAQESGAHQDQIDMITQQKDSRKAQLSDPLNGKTNGNGAIHV